MNVSQSNFIHIYLQQMLTIFISNTLFFQRNYTSLTMINMKCSLNFIYFIGVQNQCLILLYYFFYNMNKERYYKTILKHLEDTNIRNYITTSQQKLELCYPERNINNEQHCVIEDGLLSIDCQMVKTTAGNELVQVVIINQQYQIIYNKWFKPQNQITDYVTHITGLTKQIFQSKDLNVLTQYHINQVQQIIKSHIVVGHDIANDLRVLPVSHHLFIDTIALLPHNLGLPFKNKLKILAYEHLNRVIQWGAHDPTQDAKAALDIVLLIISEGRGIVLNVETPIPKSHYMDIDQLFKQSQLQKQKIIGFFLRGSRALELEVQLPVYQSDWDYFCIYDTTTRINGRLIKLYNTDITIYDAKTFYSNLDLNDVPAVELFFLPEKCQFINKLKQPNIQIGLFRESLGYHLGKCTRKIKRFKQTLKGDKKQWKLLKTYHLKVRFMDYFLQISQSTKIYDVKRSKPIWEQLKKLYLENNFNFAEKWILDKIYEYYTDVRKAYRANRPLRHHSQYTQKQLSSEHNSKITQKAIKFKEKSNCRDQVQYLLLKYTSAKLYCSANPLKLALVDELQAHGLQRLDQFRIAYKRHIRQPNLIQFHYMQSANFKNQICRQSRGIILDESLNYEVVALPYLKFFDFNDSKYTQVDQFDFTSCRLYEKYDGSIATMYNYRGQWQIASAKVPDGQNSYCFARLETTTQFKMEFLKIFYSLKYKLPTLADVHLTFVFQLLSKDHIIVVRRQVSDIILHGVIDRRTGRQLNHKHFAVKYGWNYSIEIPVQIYNIQSVVSMAQKLNPLKQEGYILCDKNHKRMKVKNSDYVRINWLAELNMTPIKNTSKYILTQIVLSGEHQSFSNYCPEWSNLINSILQKIQFLNRKCQQIYHKVKHLEGEKLSKQIIKEEKYLHPFIYGLCSNYQKWNNRLQYFMNSKRLDTYLEKIK